MKNNLKKIKVLPELIQLQIFIAYGFIDSKKKIIQNKYFILEYIKMCLTLSQFRKWQLLFNDH